MDKREAVRIPVRARARCRVQEGVVLEGVVDDVSRGGVFMRAPGQMAVGAATELDLDLPGEPTLHLLAKVVRVEVGADEVGLALEFTAVDPHEKLPLANFIMRQHATVIR